eukprot:949913-Prymnesium_polylepis.1
MIASVPTVPAGQAVAGAMPTVNDESCETVSPAAPELAYVPGRNRQESPDTESCTHVARVASGVSVLHPELATSSPVDPM